MTEISLAELALQVSGSGFWQVDGGKELALLRGQRCQPRGCVLAVERDLMELDSASDFRKPPLPIHP